MRLLVVTNLYPPQELGGYGRSIADFVWGLRQRGHEVMVLTSDASYLGDAAPWGPSGELVDRSLQLKGTYQGGVQRLDDPVRCAALDSHNAAHIRDLHAHGSWDGVLVGNLDLMGPELLQPLLAIGVPVVHHVGFVSPPFHPDQFPRSSLYQLVPASQAVRQALASAGLPVADAPVVYPGARTELFGAEATGMAPPFPADGSAARPLKVCFAGLLMGSKGAHTVVDALAQLHREGFKVQGTLAGAAFQTGYREQLEAFIVQSGLEGSVQWVGQLQRPALARMMALHHVGVFPSIHPEAFGIVGAEMMASGLALVTSGVGGAAELVENGVSGLRFEAGDASALAGALRSLAAEPSRQRQLALAGQQRVRRRFSVAASAEQLEGLFQPSPILVL